MNENKKTFLIPILIPIIIILIGLILQLIIGNINFSLFAFPLNVILLFLILFFIIQLKKSNNHKFKNIYYYLSSIHCSLSSIFTIVLLSLIIGIVPQSFSFYINNTDDILGLYQLNMTWYFAFALLYFIVNLFAVIIKRITKINYKNIIFILIHLGIFLVVVAMFFGKADYKNYKIILNKETFSNNAVTDKLQNYSLPFFIKINNISIEKYDNGELKNSVVKIDITDFMNIYDDKENSNFITVSISVNSPFKYKGYNIYLFNYDTINMDKCVCYLVYSPWDYIIIAGIIFMLLGTMLLFINKGRANSELG